MLPLEETVLLMAVLLIVLLVTLTVIAIFRPRARGLYGLRAWLTAVATSRAKKSLPRENKRLLPSVPQARESPSINTSVCKLKTMAYVLIIS